MLFVETVDSLSIVHLFCLHNPITHRVNKKKRHEIQKKCRKVWLYFEQKKITQPLWYLSRRIPNELTQVRVRILLTVYCTVVCKTFKIENPAKVFLFQIKKFKRTVKKLNL